MKTLILKSLLIGLPLLMFSIDSNAWIIYQRVCINGDHGKYDATSISETPWKKTITCLNPGTTSCPSVADIGGSSSDNSLMQYALYQIANGNTSGSYTNTLGRTVTWSGSDVDNNDIEING
jgi:hypothetical protein